MILIKMNLHINVEVIQIRYYYCRHELVRGKQNLWTDALINLKMPVQGTGAT